MINATAPFLLFSPPSSTLSVFLSGGAFANRGVVRIKINRLDCRFSPNTSTRGKHRDDITHRYRYIKEKETDVYCAIAGGHSFNTGNRLVSTVYSPIFLELTVICYLLPQLQILHTYPIISCLSLLLSSRSSWNKQKCIHFSSPLILGGIPIVDSKEARVPSSAWELVSLARELGRKMGTAGWLPATPGPSPVLYSRSPTYPCKRPRIPASLDARFQCDRPRYFCVDSAARLKVDSRLWGIGIIRGTRPTRFAKLCQRPTRPTYVYISETQVRAPFFLPFLSSSPNVFHPGRLARVSSNAISLYIEPFIRANRKYRGVLLD